MIPRVFYNGCGPHDEDHGLMSILKKTKDPKLLHKWNLRHDLFDTFFIVVFCFVLSFVIFVGFMGAGGVFGGFRGLAAGAAVGVTSARITLVAMNELLGATDKLISIVNEELKSYQPCRRWTR